MDLMKCVVRHDLVKVANNRDGSLSVSDPAAPSKTFVS